MTPKLGSTGAFGRCGRHKKWGVVPQNRSLSHVAQDTAKSRFWPQCTQNGVWGGQNGLKRPNMAHAGSPMVQNAAWAHHHCRPPGQLGPFCSVVATDESQLGVQGPGCAGLMVSRRGTNPPSFGAVRTVALEILKPGPPLARLLAAGCLFARNGSPPLDLSRLRLAVLGLSCLN